MSHTTLSTENQHLYVLGPVDDRQATDFRHQIQVLDTEELTTLRSFLISDACSMLYHVSPNERFICGKGVQNRDLHVWDTITGETLVHLDDLGGSSNSRDLAVFSPDNRYLAYGNERWEIILWDLVEKCVAMRLGPHPWRVYAISFSHDGRYIASSSWEGDIRIHDLDSGRELSTLYGHGSGVHGHSFSNDDATLVSGGDDSSVRFWHVATGREMLVFEQSYNQLNRIPFLSPTNQLAVWRDFAEDLRYRVQAIPSMDEIEAAHGTEKTATPLR
jgi:hypothetical protein